MNTAYTLFYLRTSCFGLRLNVLKYFEDFSLKCSLKPVDVDVLKVTVQLKTEGNGQSEIVSHMERSEVKL